MKKILFLLLVTIASYGQTYQNPTFGTVTTKTAPTTTTDPYVGSINANGVIGKVAPENIPVNVIPPTTHYTPTTSTLKGHLQGIDNAIGNIPLTTAGNTTRVWFTGDATTITAGTFYLTNPSNKGTVANVSQSVTNDDNQKKYFTQDLIGQPFATATIFPPGVYAGNLSASTTPNSAQQRFTVELYKCNNAGTPIASGVAGAPVGDLGVTVILILDSGLLTLADGSVTNVPVSASLASQFSIGVGERIRYHVSAEKVGTASSNITESVWYGNSFNSFLDVPTPITSSGVSNVSTVLGASVTNALDNLKTADQDIAGAGVTYGHITDGAQTIYGEKTFNSNINAPTYNGYVPLDESNTEGARLDTTLTPIYAWGDSLTAGAGSTGGLTYPADLQALSNFTVTNKGVGGETSTQIKDRLVADAANYSKSVIIWAGRNNYSSPSTVKADIATMISTIGHTRYLVVGIINGDYVGEYINQANWTIINQLNTDLKALYGDKFVDIRPYLVSLHNNTAQDLADFANDIPPTSLRSDNIHLNNAGYLKVAEFINKKLGDLYNQTPYFQSKDFSYYANKYSISNSTAQQTASFNINGAGTLNSFVTRAGTNTNNNATHHVFQTSFSNRIAFSLTGAEAGSNTGSNLSLIGYNDSGSVITNGLTFFRGTGNFVLQNGISVPTDTGYRLDINGTLRTQGTVTLGGPAPETSAGTYDILTRNTVNGNVEKVASTAYATTASPTFTGTPTAPTASPGTNTTQIATTAFVQTATRPYKSYTATISQSGTSDPTVNIFENTLSGAIVWTRNSAGSYTGTLSGAFTDLKTVFFNSNNGGSNTTPMYFKLTRTSSDTVLLNSSVGTTFTDAILSSLTIEIRVYN